MSTTETLARPAADRAAAAARTGAVLIATHGAATADAAIRWAYAYARRQQLPVIVVDAVQPIVLPAEYAGNYVDLDRIQREAAQERVTGQLARVIDGQLPAVQVEVGFPVDIVATRAATEGSSLVVVGRGRQELLTRFLGGETAIGVLRRTRTPVLAVATDAAWPPTVVMVATDFSPSATRAAELAVALAADGATIHLVHVQSAVDPSAAGQAWESVYAAGTAALFLELQGRLRLPKGATVRTHLRSGDPAEMLIQLARDEHADLLATGTHSKRFMDRLTLGSVAEHVLRGAPCSVLVTPDPIAAETTL